MPKRGVSFSVSGIPVFWIPCSVASLDLCKLITPYPRYCCSTRDDFLHKFYDFLQAFWDYFLQAFWDDFLQAFWNDFLQNFWNDFLQAFWDNFLQDFGTISCRNLTISCRIFGRFLAGFFDDFLQAFWNDFS